MNKISIITFLLFSVFPFVAKAQMTGDKVLDKSAKVITSAPSMTVNFTVGTSRGNSSGWITMSGKKFIFSSGDLKVWYDGTSQWALQRSVSEISLTTPTASELVDSNPFELISRHKQLFTAKLLSTSKEGYRVQLTPKSKGSQIKAATVTINSSSFMPKSLDVTMHDGQKMKINVTSTSQGKTLSAAYFKYNPKANPGVELIDLR